MLVIKPQLQHKGGEDVSPFVITWPGTLTYFKMENRMPGMNTTWAPQGPWTGAITLFPPKHKDRLFLKNCRPISLINIDYYCKRLLNSLKKVLPSIHWYTVPNCTCAQVRLWPQVDPIVSKIQEVQNVEGRKKSFV